MTQLTQHPFKEVIKRAGALHFWEPDPATNEVIDAIGGLDLVRSPAGNTSYSHMIAREPGWDDLSGEWVGPVLDYRGYPFDGKQQYLSAPTSLRSLPSEFSIGCRLWQSAPSYGRGGLRIALSASAVAHAFVDGTYNFTTQTYTLDLVLRGPGIEKRVPLGGPFVFGSLPRFSMFLMVSAAGGSGRLDCAIAGVGIFSLDFAMSAGAVFPGFLGAPAPEIPNYSDVTNDSARFSNAFYLDRQASSDEVARWAKLLETGRQGDGRCLPLNNSEGMLAAGIDLTSTLLTLEDGTEAFPVPGPTEEGRITLSSLLNPDVFEVCALLVNDGGQLEVRRGEEGTEARDWPAGTLVKGLLTRWLVEAPVNWIPSYANGGYRSEQPSYSSLRDKPFIPALPSDIGAASQQALGTLSTQLAGLQTDHNARIAELERGPTWASIRGKPMLPSMVDIEELHRIITAMMLRIIALEAGEGGGSDTADWLVDQNGQHLSDATGAPLTRPLSVSGALLDQFGAQLADASGNILTGPTTLGNMLSDVAGQMLTDANSALLISA